MNYLLLTVSVNSLNNQSDWFKTKAGEGGQIKKIELETVLKINK